MLCGYLYNNWREYGTRRYGMHENVYARSVEKQFPLCRDISWFRARRGEKSMLKLDEIKDEDKFFELWTKELEKELSGFWNEFLK